MKRKKLISKIIQYKLESSPKIKLAFLYPKAIQNFFWKTIDFVKNLEMTQIAWDARGEIMFIASL